LTWKGTLHPSGRGIIIKTEERASLWPGARERSTKAKVTGELISDPYSIISQFQDAGKIRHLHHRLIN